ncbi:hypothetical protein A9K55_000160 [Cordyceps militaris]|uniref:Uncharacterized protein n=1 Tax=Cordyceps militaris TaxID=73501 RepID=A0A2H4SVV3_CORMI|nr:hypothetical protein A9K55_000160 [Cordyceps militaris]
MRTPPRAQSKPPAAPLVLSACDQSQDISPPSSASLHEAVVGSYLPTCSPSAYLLPTSRPNATDCFILCLISSLSHELDLASLDVRTPAPDPPRTCPPNNRQTLAAPPITQTHHAFYRFVKELNTNLTATAQVAPNPMHPGQVAGSVFAPPHVQMQIQSQPSDRSVASQGRKRSRDEAGANLEPDAPPRPIVEPQDDWVYGEGMTLIKPNAGYVADASTQSGTWMEEETASADAEVKRQLEAAQVNVRSRKLQRMGSDEAPTAASRGSVSPTTPAPESNGPVIDNFTLHLGIGWRKISDDDHIQAAARGWAKFIENHYPLSDVQICLESKGLQSYLVKATDGFFLFSEDLRQARLVSHNAETALRNLQQSPPVFESAETLSSVGTPTALTPSGNDMDMNMS